MSDPPAPHHQRSPDTSHVLAVVPTFHRPTSLAEVLESVRSQTALPAVVVVVDNGGDPATARLVEERLGPDIPSLVFSEEDNVGPAGGTAIGMKRAMELPWPDGWVLRLDDDRPLPGSEFLRERLDFAEAALAEDPGTGAVGLVGARFDHRSGRLDRVPDDDLHGLVSVDYLATNHFPLFRISAVRTVGPMDADLFFGLTEVEYGLRLRDAGFRLYADGDAWESLRRQWRPTGPPPRLQPGSPWRRYYSLRNQVHLTKRRSPLRAARLVVTRCIGASLVRAVRYPRTGPRAVHLGALAAVHGWSGRLGRTIDPARELDQEGHLPPT